MLFRLMIGRFWRQHPLRTFILIAILAMGVSVFLSIRLANRAAVQSFGQFAERITGRVDFRLQADAGGLRGDWLRDLRQQLDGHDVALSAIVESSAVWPNDPTQASDGQDKSPADADVQKLILGQGGADDGIVYTLLGLDLFAAATAAAGTGDPSQGRYHDEPFWESNQPPLWLSMELAERYQLEPGDALPLLIRDRFVTFKLQGILPSKDGQSLGNTLVTDLPILQSLLERTEWIDLIEVRLESRLVDREWLRQRLIEAGKNRWRVDEPEDRRETGEALTRAFRYNLTVLSLMALVVGLFLIHQSMDATVVRRRQEIATMRALGVSEGSILRLWLGEGLLLGLAGSLLGILLGWGLAQWTVRAIARTVNTLYMNTAVDAASLHPEEALLGVILGVTASLAACWGPAKRAAKTPPAQMLGHFAQQKIQTHSRLPSLGLFLLLTGAFVYVFLPILWPVSGESPITGYAAALLLIAGASFSMPFWLKPLAMRLKTTGGSVMTLALSRFRMLTGRHRFTTAGLLVAIVLTGSMAVMVHSFERTVTNWIENILAADLYMRPMGTESVDTRNRITMATASVLADMEGITEVHGIHKRDIVLDNKPVVLEATDLQFILNRSKALWIDAPSSLEKAEANAVVSEAFARHFRAKKGGTLTLPTLKGPRKVTIQGIYAEYGNQRGSIIIDSNYYRGWYEETGYLALALFVEPGHDPETTAQSVRQAFPGLFVRTNGDLKVMALQVFRQTFALTYALEAIGIFVAITGLAFALISLLLERRGELTTLRALGMIRWKMAAATGLEGLFLSTWGGFCGLVTGLAVGHVLVYNINRNVFGWTLGFSVPWLQLAALLVAVAATGWLVSFAAGWWGAQLPAEQEE